MTVQDIIDTFTDDDFTLIVYDLHSDTELYNGDASDVWKDDDIASLEVVSIDPPEKAWEIVLNVNVSEM